MCTFIQWIINVIRAWSGPGEKRHSVVFAPGRRSCRCQWQFNLSSSPLQLPNWALDWRLFCMLCSSFAQGAQCRQCAPVEYVSLVRLQSLNCKDQKSSKLQALLHQHTQILVSQKVEVGTNEQIRSADKHEQTQHFSQRTMMKTVLVRCRVT